MFEAGRWCHVVLPLPELVMRVETDKPRLLELSALMRLGVKGPRARASLAAAGIEAPTAPNHVALCEAGIFVAALSKSEFLLSGVPGVPTTAIVAFRQFLARAPEETYLVEHAEALYCFGLTGAARQEVYARLCAIDFDNPAAAPGRVLQTKLAHLSTIILRCDDRAGSYDLVLGDVSYATYMWRTLLDTVLHLGGDAMGIKVGGAS